MKYSMELPLPRVGVVGTGLERLATLRRRARATPQTRNTPPARLSLALQGGGSYGAFTWGVLERLADQENLSIDMISGASAGAVNAVLFASGYGEDGPAGAQRRLTRFWSEVGKARSTRPFSLPLPGSKATLAMLEASTLFVSPYQFNPLGLNPLRDLLEAEVDFARLRQNSPIRLMIAATRVRDGALRLFNHRELTVEMVLASACLPKLHHAVEIDGEAYWDGGFAANPPLRQLAIDTDAADILLVQIMPREVHKLPQSTLEISRRTTTIAFNSAYERELEALGHLQASVGGILPALSPDRRRLRQLRLHHLSAVDPRDGLTGENMLDTNPTFLADLHQRGQQATSDWLNNPR